jgi:hypothetical protein
MRASLFCVLGLLAGCPASTPTAPLTPPVEPPTVPVAPPPEPATATATPAPAPVAVLGQPWKRTEPIKGHQYVDDFTFLGWSADSARYAFEVSEETQGADCGASHSLYVVEAARDAYAPDGTAVIKHDSPEGGPNGCSPKDLGPILTNKRTELLARHGIEPGHLTAPLTLKTLGGSGLVVAGDLRFSFEVLHAAGQDVYGEAAQKGAAYKLVLSPEGEARTLEPGTRRRAYVLHYALTGNPLFVSPDGRQAAIVVSRVHTAFEGSRLSWMTNGFTLYTAPSQTGGARPCWRPRLG